MPPAFGLCLALGLRSQQYRAGRPDRAAAGHAAFGRLLCLRADVDDDGAIAQGGSRGLRVQPDQSLPSAAEDLIDRAPAGPLAERHCNAPAELP